MDQETSFEMNRALALEIKEYRQSGCTWRRLSEKFAEAHPDLPVDPGNQIEGMSLCEEAGEFLNEDHHKW